MKVYCTYCGELATSLDHVVPVSYHHTSRRASFYTKDNCIPCCTECNNALGSVFLTTIAERASHLIDFYNKKYKKLLQSPEWDSIELEELGEMLKEIILQKQLKRNILIERLQNLLSVFHKDPDIDDIWNNYNFDAFSIMKPRKARQ